MRTVSLSAERRIGELMAAQKETVGLAKGGKACADGAMPEASIIIDGSGHVYGTTAHGGTHGNNGSVFELTPNATKTKWTEAARSRLLAGRQIAELTPHSGR